VNTHRPRLVVKIGTSSITAPTGEVDTLAIDKLCTEVADARRRGHEVVVVTSGAITAGLPLLGIERPTDPVTLQAISAVGQIELMRVWSELLARHGLRAGQVLLAPLDFRDRGQYLHARETIERLLEIGVVPVVNENDAIADDEIRFGDNDRLAVLVAHLLGAGLLVLLTDSAGLHTADPRFDPDASLIEEILEVDATIERLAGRSGEVRGSGGMASKVQAAKMAAWTGIRTVIAAADRPGVVQDSLEGRAGVGTVVQPRSTRLSARRLWIAFAVGAAGRITVDEGARRALVERSTSLLPAGVVGVEGDFEPMDAVELAGPDGTVFAKGLVRLRAGDLRTVAGRRTADLPDNIPHLVVHRDDLVMLPGSAQ
jgi:glutamate 5-kinase